MSSTLSSKSCTTPLRTEGTQLSCLPLEALIDEKSTGQLALFKTDKKVQTSYRNLRSHATCECSQATTVKLHIFIVRTAGHNDTFGRKHILESSSIHCCELLMRDHTQNRRIRIGEPARHPIDIIGTGVVKKLLYALKIPSKLCGEPVSQPARKSRVRTNMGLNPEFYLRPVGIESMQIEGAFRFDRSAVMKKGYLFLLYLYPKSENRTALEVMRCSRIPLRQSVRTKKTFYRCLWGFQASFLSRVTKTGTVY